MKKLEIIIRPGKLDDLQEILELCEYHGITILNVMGYGKQKGNVKPVRYRGSVQVNLLPKLKVECVVTNDESETIVRQVCKEIRTGNYGDGKVFVYDVADVIRVRTGERGEGAL